MKYNYAEKFYIKKEVAIGAIVLWNILLLLDLITFFLGIRDGFPLEYGAIIAFGLIFLACILFLFSKKFRQLTLNKGRSLNDIKRSAILGLLVSGILLFLIIGILTGVLN